MAPVEWAERVRIDGYVRLPRAATAELMTVTAEDWRIFAGSWDDLGPDEFMADGGRYRRRRFGVMTLEAGVLTVQPHQPHFQAVDYNPLNGGVDRWFEPIRPEILGHPVVTDLVDLSRGVFGLDGARDGWRVELHQFRIEARADALGQPTPEGVHRDGVDWVAVMLVARVNVEQGVTAIFDPQRNPLGAFTLAEAMDAVLLDDRRVLHGVTPIAPLDPGAPAWRDVLVVTFRAAG